MLYDAERLYIGVHAFDAEPAASSRPRCGATPPRILEEDNFQIILDTFRDSRSGYMFVTNPLGAKLEQQIFEEGGGNARGAASNINRNWDGVWMSRRAGRVTMAGRRRSRSRWSRSDRPTSTTQDWGINFMRNIRQEERAGVLGADSQAVQPDAGQPGGHGLGDERAEPRPRPAHQAVSRSGAGQSDRIGSDSAQPRLARRRRST